MSGTTCYVLRVLYAKMPICEAGFSKKCTNLIVFENALESWAHEYVILRTPPNTKGKGIFASGANFGTFNVCFSQKCAFARLVLVQSPQTTHCFENAPESRAHEYAILRAPPAKKKKFGAFYVCFTQICLFEKLILAKSARRR